MPCRSRTSVPACVKIQCCSVSFQLFLFQLLRGLQYCHTRKILHRYLWTALTFDHNSFPNGPNYWNRNSYRVIGRNVKTLFLFHGLCTKYSIAWHIPRVFVWMLNFMTQKGKECRWTHLSPCFRAAQISVLKLMYRPPKKIFSYDAMNKWIHSKFAEMCRVWGA